ncbi:MAG: stage III sporulation protein AE [Lachnospiraceae bacterium]|nr:stage III sporulation protein AE [Lachnospiraceae bacterium]
MPDVVKEDLSYYIDLNGIDSAIQGIKGGEGISVKDLLLELITGDLAGVISILKEGTIDRALEQFAGYRSIVIAILILGIISAVFAGFGRVFQSHQISDISFYLVYLALVIVLLQVFGVGMEIAYEMTETIVSFARILIPTYLFTVGMAAGNATAFTFYQIVLCIIYFVESILVALMIPLIYCYVFMAVVNGVSESDRLSHLLELLKKGMEYLLKAALTMITGISVLQAMITPVVDNVRTSLMQKVVAGIPGIGGIADTAAQTVYGSLVIIKNSVGVVFILLLFFICIVPFIKLLFLSVIIKGCSAFIGIISEKRMTVCVNRVGDGMYLLLKLSITTIALFVISIAIVAVTTNRGIT